MKQDILDVEKLIIDGAAERHYPLNKANLNAHGTGGKLYHAFRKDARESDTPALCGTRPGKRGYWSSYFGKEVTCPKCRSIIEKGSR